MVRASDCHCTRFNGPGFDASIRRHSGIWGAADEAVLNIVRKKIIPPKNIQKKKKSESFKKLARVRTFPADDRQQRVQASPFLFSKDSLTRVCNFLVNLTKYWCTLAFGSTTEFWRNSSSRAWIIKAVDIDLHLQKVSSKHNKKTLNQRKNWLFKKKDWKYFPFYLYSFETLLRLFSTKLIIVNSSYIVSPRFRSLVLKIQLLYFQSHNIKS